MGIDAELKSLEEMLGAERAAPQNLARLNDRLNALKLGIEVFLPQSPFCPSADQKGPVRGEEAKRCSAWILGYGPVAGEGWCLAARPVLAKVLAPGERHKPEELVYQGPPVSLLKLPRHVQLGAAALAPELLQEIRGRLHTALRSIELARLMPEAFAKLHHSDTSTKRRD